MSAYFDLNIYAGVRTHLCACVIANHICGAFVHMIVCVHTYLPLILQFVCMLCPVQLFHGVP